MVLLNDIYVGEDTKRYAPLIHISLHHDSLSLLPWVFKYLVLGHQILNSLHPWLLFSVVLVLVLSSNILKGWTLSWGVYIPYLHIHIIGSLLWFLIYWYGGFIILLNFQRGVLTTKNSFGIQT